MGRHAACLCLSPTNEVPPTRSASDASTRRAAGVGMMAWRAGRTVSIREEDGVLSLRARRLRLDSDRCDIVVLPAES